MPWYNGFCLRKYAAQHSTQRPYNVTVGEAMCGKTGSTNGKKYPKEKSKIISLLTNLWNAQSPYFQSITEQRKQGRPKSKLTIWKGVQLQFNLLLLHGTLLCLQHNVYIYCYESGSLLHSAFRSL